jgi:malate permease and related proteins
VLSIFLPALAFNFIATAHFDRTFFVIPLIGVIVITASMLAGFAVYSLIPYLNNIPRPAVGVLIFASAFGNVIVLGLPIISELLSVEYAYVSILYDQLAATPMLLTIGAFIAARYGSGKTVSLAASCKRVLMLPPLWGVIAGIIIHLIGLRVPQLVLETTALMGKAVVPIMVFMVGLALDFHDVKRLPIALPALALKMLIGPVLAWWIGSQFGLAADSLKAITIVGAMPMMVIALVIADEFDLDVPLTAMCIAISTVAVFLTLPVVMHVLF